MNLNQLPGDKATVRAYVTGADHLQFSALAEGSVQVQVTHSNLRQFIRELRLDKHMTIADVKARLHSFNGSNTAHMELQLKDQSGALVVRMLDDSRMLGYYPVENGMEIHAVDHDPYSLSRDGGLDDVSRIEKYHMTEDDYDKRENTYRAWKRKMQEADPSWKPPHLAKAGGAGGEAAPPMDYSDPACVEQHKVGSRCSVGPGDRRGEIAFVGPVAELAAGFWVGVVLDEPLGKGDGSVKGKRYFEAEAKCGSFVRPDRVAVGHFPPAWEDDSGDAVPESAAAAATGGDDGEL